MRSPSDGCLGCVPLLALSHQAVRKIEYKPLCGCVCNCLGVGTLLQFQCKALLLSPGREDRKILHIFFHSYSLSPCFLSLCPPFISWFHATDMVVDYPLAC